MPPIIGASPQFFLTGGGMAPRLTHTHLNTHLQTQMHNNVLKFRKNTYFALGYGLCVCACVFVCVCVCACLIRSVEQILEEYKFASSVLPFCRNGMV